MNYDIVDISIIIVIMIIFYHMYQDYQEKEKQKIESFKLSNLQKGLITGGTLGLVGAGSYFAYRQYQKEQKIADEMRKNAMQMQDIVEKRKKKSKGVELKAEMIYQSMKERDEEKKGRALTEKEIGNLQKLATSYAKRQLYFENKVNIVLEPERQHDAFVRQLAFLPEEEAEEFYKYMIEKNESINNGLSFLEARKLGTRLRRASIKMNKLKKEEKNIMERTARMNTTNRYEELNYIMKAGKGDGDKMSKGELEQNGWDESLVQKKSPNGIGYILVKSWYNKKYKIGNRNHPRKLSKAQKLELNNLTRFMWKDTGKPCTATDAQNFPDKCVLGAKDMKFSSLSKTLALWSPEAKKSAEKEAIRRKLEDPTKLAIEDAQKIARKKELEEKRKDERAKRLKKEILKEARMNIKMKKNKNKNIDKIIKDSKGCLCIDEGLKSHGKQWGPQCSSVKEDGNELNAKIPVNYKISIDNEAPKLMTKHKHICKTLETANCNVKGNIGGKDYSQEESQFTDKDGNRYSAQACINTKKLEKAGFFDTDGDPPIKWDGNYEKEELNKLIESAEAGVDTCKCMGWGKKIAFNTARLAPKIEQTNRKGALYGASCLKEDAWVNKDKDGNDTPWCYIAAGTCSDGNKSEQTGAFYDSEGNSVSADNVEWSNNACGAGEISKRFSEQRKTDFQNLVSLDAIKNRSAAHIYNVKRTKADLKEWKEATTNLKNTQKDTVIMSENEENSKEYKDAKDRRIKAIIRVRDIIYQRLVQMKEVAEESLTPTKLQVEQETILQHELAKFDLEKLHSRAKKIGVNIDIISKIINSKAYEIEERLNEIKQRDQNGEILNESMKNEGLEKNNQLIKIKGKAIEAIIRRQIARKDVIKFAQNSFITKEGRINYLTKRLDTDMKDYEDFIEPLMKNSNDLLVAAYSLKNEQERRISRRWQKGWAATMRTRNIDPITGKVEPKTSKSRVTWTKEKKGKEYINGTQKRAKAREIDKCKTECRMDTDCVAIDWNKKNRTCNINYPSKAEGKGILMNVNAEDETNYKNSKDYSSWGIKERHGGKLLKMNRAAKAIIGIDWRYEELTDEQKQNREKARKKNHERNIKNELEAQGLSEYRQFVQDMLKEAMAIKNWLDKSEENIKEMNENVDKFNKAMKKLTTDGFDHCKCLDIGGSVGGQSHVGKKCTPDHLWDHKNRCIPEEEEKRCRDPNQNCPNKGKCPEAKEWCYVPRGACPDGTPVYNGPAKDTVPPIWAGGVALGVGAIIGLATGGAAAAAGAASFASIAGGIAAGKVAGSATGGIITNVLKGTDKMDKERYDVSTQACLKEQPEKQKAEMVRFILEKANIDGLLDRIARMKAESFKNATRLHKFGVELGPIAFDKLKKSVLFDSIKFDVDGMNLKDEKYNALNEAALVKSNVILIEEGVITPESLKDTESSLGSLATSFDNPFEALDAAEAARASRREEIAAKCKCAGVKNQLKINKDGKANSFYGRGDNCDDNALSWNGSNWCYIEPGSCGDLHTETVRESDQMPDYQYSNKPLQCKNKEVDVSTESELPDPESELPDPEPELPDGPRELSEDEKWDEARGDDLAAQMFLW